MENITFTFHIYSLKTTAVWKTGKDGFHYPTLKEVKTHVGTQHIDAKTEEDAHRRLTLKVGQWGECQPF